jgi:hypothetical protein
MAKIGSDTQVFTLPDTLSTNIDLCFNPLGQQQLLNSGMNGFGFNVPMTQLPSVNDYITGLLNPALNTITSQRINTCIANINMAKQRLNSMLQKEGITEDEKKAINEKLDELKAQEDQLKELTTGNNITPSDAYKKSGEIEDAVRKIIVEINNIGRGNAGNNNGADGSNGTDGTNGSNGTAGSGNAGNASGNGSVGNSNGKLTLSTEIKQDLLAFNDAIDYFWGTKNDQLNAVMENINSENVMDYMTGWNKSYSDINGESFMEAFIWDANHEQKKTYCRQVAFALREKAEELGIYDECSADFAKINKEVAGWVWISNDISTNFDNIIKKIAEKMGGDYKKYAKPKKKAA